MMDFFFGHVPPHIAVALGLAMVGLLLEAVDAYRLPPTDGDSYRLMSQLKAQGDKTETAEQEGKEGLKEKLRLLRTRVTVFSILFSIFGMNVEVVAQLVFDVTLGWIQNAAITIGPVAYLSYALERLNRFHFKD